MRKRKKVDEQARNAKEKEMRASSGDKKKKRLTICLLLCNHDTLCLAGIIGECTRGKSRCEIQESPGRGRGERGHRDRDGEGSSIGGALSCVLSPSKKQGDVSTENVSLEPKHLPNDRIAVLAHE